MLIVSVSPYISISEWVDPYSGITLSKEKGRIEIPDGTDLTGIRKYIRLNQLILIEETPEQPKVVEEIASPVSEPEATSDTIEETQQKALTEMTVAELKDLAKSLGIPGYSSMKKAELIEAIENHK